MKKKKDDHKKTRTLTRGLQRGEGRKGGKNPMAEKSAGENHLRAAKKDPSEC